MSQTDFVARLETVAPAERTRVLLAEFAFTYSVYYAGLASPMIALVFLYFTASIFIYGGELNAVIVKLREPKEPETVDRK